MEIKEYKCIDFLETLYALQQKECEELGIPVPEPGQWLKLPDGREDIFHRLWDKLMQDQWGNQQFTNDCFYRVPFETYEDGTIVNINDEDDLSDDVKTLLEYTKEALNDGGDGFVFLLFYVSW